MEMNQKDFNTLYATTILCVKRNNQVVMCADGQVTLGHTIVKASAKKLRRIISHNVLAGFAGSAADGLALFERLEGKLEKHPGQLTRACVELSKEWRSDRVLRRLEAMLIVADKNDIFVLSGMGDVMKPEYNIAAIGSGGNYALSAALALMHHSEFTAEKIAKEAMNIAGDICIYTNKNLTMEVINS